MASVLTHTAVPLLIGRAIKLPDGVSRGRLAVAATICACVPDLDFLSVLFDARAWDPLGHRGFFHSLVFAAVLAMLVTVASFRRARRQVLPLLFAAAASHPLLDVLTRGDVGVALFAPLSFERFLFPLRPIPVSPLGAAEYLGAIGATVLANELLLVVIPVAIATEIVRRVRAGLPFDSLTRATAGWIVGAAALWVVWPQLYAPAGPRLLRGFGAPGSDDDLRWINPAPLPDQQLVTRFEVLRAHFGGPLVPARAPWSGGFFPAWFGGEAGRWHDGKLTLIARTLTGFDLLKADEAKAWLERDHGQWLSPTEKYDLANGDYGFSATRHSLSLSHNARPRPRFWFGLCNGVAAAALDRPEPYRAVDVKSPDGHVVRFHPVDVKALLAEAYYWEADTGVLGGDRCEVDGFDTGRVCSMNPGGLLIGTVNYLARAHRSFLLDVFPTRQAQYMAVASAQIDLVRGPYAPTGEPFEPGFKERVAQLADVEFTFELSSTFLSEEDGNVPAPGGETRFEKVGLHTIPFHWSATIALNEGGEVIGGRWRGDPADGPDNIAFMSGGPLLLDGGTALELHPGLQWPFIDALASASVAEGDEVPLLVADGGR